MTTALERELSTLDRAGLRRTLRPVERRRGSEVWTGSNVAVDFSSNDYLGLAGDPRLAAAVTEFLADDATGSAAARLISGNHPVHDRLERELASFKGTESARLFSSGYMANVGTIAALVGKRDVIYADALNHASLIDATRLSRAEVRTFPHADVESLRKLLAGDAGKFRRRLIVVDGVFSMDGDLFPLDELVPIAREHDAWTYVDDAHATAIVGATGRGTAEHFGVEGEIDVIMGTLGKALGTMGAFVAGSSTLADFLLHRARTFVFTTAPAPALAAATLEALRIVREEPWRRDHLYENARALRGALAECGITTMGVPDSFVIPVLVGDVDATVRIGMALRELGFLVGAVRPPTVPVGTSRLRLTVTAAHTSEQIASLATSLARVMREAHTL